ncbi:MAG: hypothetical protein IT159_02270 [Bryobacterales bacterium]|nr:hypothetical protein [Bryobacterales bacterium]
MSRESRRIVIGRIVLDGVDLSPAQQDAFRSRLAGELERRLAEDWVDGLAERHRGEVRPPSMELAAGAQPADIAVQVASRVVEGLKG